MHGKGYVAGYGYFDICTGRYGHFLRCLTSALWDTAPKGFPFGTLFYLLNFSRYLENTHPSLVV